MKPATRDVLRGFASLAAVNALFALVAFLGMNADLSAFLLPLFAIGFVQLLWCLPWQIWAFVTGRKAFGIGLVIAASLTLLVNGGCFLAVAGGMH